MCPPPSATLRPFETEGVFQHCRAEPSMRLIAQNHSDGPSRACETDTLAKEKGSPIRIITVCLDVDAHRFLQKSLGGDVV